MPLRIALITLNPERSGQLTSILSLASGLENRGHAVKIITPLFRGTLDEYKKTQDTLAHRRIIFQSLSPLLILFREQKNFDLIQLHLPTPGFTLLGVLLQIFIQKPFIIVFYNRFKLSKISLSYVWKYFN